MNAEKSYPFQGHTAIRAPARDCLPGVNAILPDSYKQLADITVALLTGWDVDIPERIRTA